MMNNKTLLTSLITATFGLALLACCHAPGQIGTPGAQSEAPEQTFPLATLLDQQVPRLIAEHRVAGVGIGVIEGGELVWTGYYGEQAPGIAATAETIFNTGSVAKTVTAEVLIALASKGLLSLDEPIASHVEHPTLSEDPRFELLTPRILLSHRAGLRNWPYEYPDRRPIFISHPGGAFSYSGMGIEMAAQFAENKLGQDFEELARNHVFEPLGLSDISIGRRQPWMRDRLAMPMNAEGAFLPIEETRGRLAHVGENGPWCAADDLLTSVEAYATFLIGVFDNRWASPELAAERQTIITSLRDNDIWGCPAEEGVACARRFGHGLGWMVYEFDDKTVIKHGGNDATENALVIYSPESRSGAVIFVNGGNGIYVSTQILGLLGREPEIAAYYRRLVGKFYGVELPPPAGLG